MANDALLKKKRIIVCLLLGLSLILSAVFSIYMEKNHILCVELIDENKIAALTEGKTLVANKTRQSVDEFVGELRYRGSKLTFDKRNNCYYVVPYGDGSQLNGEITAAADTNLYFVKDSAWNDIKSSMLSDHRFKMLILRDSEYAFADFVITTMPVLCIDTNDEGIFLDEIAANVSGFSSSNAFDCDASVNRGESGRVYKLKFSEKMSILGISSAKKYKLCNVPERDRLYMRGALLAGIWNDISEGDNLDIEGTLCEVIINGDYKGLFYAYADRNGFNQYEGMPGDEGVVNTADYFTYLQLACEYDNIRDQVDGTYAGHGIYLRPRRIEAGFGELSEKNGYLAYNSEKRLLTMEECGIVASREEEMLDAWAKYRKDTISTEKLLARVDEQVERLVSSGFIFRYAKYELGDDFNEEDEFSPVDYYMDRVAGFKAYISNRAQYIDECYALGAVKDITSEKETGDGESKEGEISEGADGGKLPKSGYLDAKVSFSYVGSSEPVEINLYFKDETVYAFLPSGADENSLKYMGKSIVSDVSEKAAESRGRICLDKAAIGGFSMSGEYALCVMKSENLPAVHINTYNKCMDYIDAFKGNKEPGDFVLYSASGEGSKKQILNSVSFRGHGSSNFKKKSYNLTFDEEVDILKLGKGEKWVLQANALDQSKIRNAITMKLAKDMNIPHSQNTAYVDLYLNGKYWGNYLVMQPVETGKTRVAIDKAAGDQLFEVINRESRLELKDVVMTDLDGMIIAFRETEGVDYRKQTFYQDKIREVNRRLRTLGDKESYEQVKEVLDTESYAKAYIMDILTNDIDAGWFSTFFTYNAADGKMYAGPLWDYDKAYGNQKDRGVYPQLDCFYHTWPEILADNEYFMEDVKAVFEKYEAAIISMIDTGADTAYESIRSSVSMNDIAIPVISGTVVNFDSPSENVAYVKDYLRQRYELLKTLIYAPETCCKVYFEGHLGRVLYVRLGECVSKELLDYIGGMYGCESFVDDAGKIFDSGIKVEADMILFPVTGM